MDDVVTRKEHEEFCKRIEAEENRQNRRLELLEESVKQNGELTISVERLATSMENMVKEQESQSRRLETIESRDGDMWRKVVGYIITAAVGIVLGFMFKQIGM